MYDSNEGRDNVLGRGGVNDRYSAFKPSRVKSRWRLNELIEWATAVEVKSLFQNLKTRGRMCFCKGTAWDPEEL